MKRVWIWLTFSCLALSWPMTAQDDAEASGKPDLEAEGPAQLLERGR